MALQGSANTSAENGVDIAPPGAMSTVACAWLAVATMLPSGRLVTEEQPSSWVDWAIREGIAPAVGGTPTTVVPRPWVLVAPSLKLQTIRSPIVIRPAVAVATVRP